MSRKNNDKDMIIASQIAYLDFDYEAVSTGKNTIGELIESIKDETKRENFEQLISDYPEVRSWKIRDIRNNQNSTGMYACLIETGDSNAIVAFRGSESDTLANKILDWGASDFGLLNSVITPQQVTAEKYMNDIYKYYGDEYDSFEVTGHSLGGNLAVHATITAPDGLKKKIEKCVNLDGPGFSNMYINSHADDINNTNVPIEHYQWSTIGTILIPLSIEHYVTVQANTPTDKGYVMNMMWRHDTKNVIYDDNGNFIRGSKDSLASKLGPFTDIIDYGIFRINYISNLTIAFVENTIDSQINKFKEFWRNFQENRYSNMDVTFEIDTSVVDAGTEEMWNIRNLMENIKEEVEEIQKNLSFSSGGTGILKMKMWSIANGIESDANKLEKLASVGRECSGHYKVAENQIVENYGL